MQTDGNAENWELTPESALQQWMAVHDQQRRRSALLRGAGPVFVAIALFLFVAWFLFAGSASTELATFFKAVSTTATYRGEERIIRTARGFENQARSPGTSDWSTYRTVDFASEPHLNPSQTVEGRILFGAVAALGCAFLFLRSKRRRYLRCDEAGILLSDSLEAGHGNAELIRWENIVSVDVPGSSIRLKLQDGRIYNVPWVHAVETCGPSVLISAIKTHAPEAARDCKKLHSL